MRNIHKENINYFWGRYTAMMDFVDPSTILVASNQTLQDFLKVGYKKAVEEVIKEAVKAGKTKQQIKYAVIKLNRTIVNLINTNVITADVKVSYSRRDILNEFPIFSAEDFMIYPTVKTISNLRVAVIDKSIEEYNKQAQANGKSGFHDLRALKFFLNKQLGIDEQNSRVLSQIYVQTTKHDWAWTKTND